MKAAAGIDARVKLAMLVAYVVVALHARTVASLALCCACAVAFTCAARLKIADASRALLPLVPIVVVTAVMQVLYYQDGPVLAQLGPVAITQEALVQAARMVVALACIMATSVSFMRVTTSGELESTLRWLLGPARAGGARTDGLMLSLAVALRFAPVLVGEFSQLRAAQIARGGAFDGGVRQRVAAYARLIAPLVRSSFNHADALAEASCARCLGAAARPASLRVLHFTARDAAVLIAFAACAAAIVWVPA